MRVVGQRGRRPRGLASSGGDLRHQVRWIWVLAVVTVVAAAWPVLQGGGVICDDWGVLKHSSDHPGVVESYLHWFPLFSNRPLAPLVLSVAANVIGFRPRVYVWVQFGLWATGVALLCAALRDRVSRVWMPIFFTLACLPAISSTVLFSPIMQLVCSTALVLAAWGLLVLEGGRGRRGEQVWPYVLFACSLLTYEMFLPLSCT
jgi:hypothetical protein